MKSLSLVDERGQPLNARLQGVLEDLVPRLQRQFPLLYDDYALTEVLEESAKKLEARERRVGPLRDLHSYAWVIARRTASERLRRSSSVVASATLESEQSTAVLAGTPSRMQTPQQIEAEVLLGQVMARLTDQEAMVCRCKLRGLSTKEIAKVQGTSVSHVKSVFFRLGQKLRNLVVGEAPDVERHIQELRRAR